MGSRRLRAALVLAAVLVASASAQTATQGAADERVRIIQNRQSERTSDNRPAREEDLRLPDSDEYARESGGWLTLSLLRLNDLDHDHNTPDLLKQVLIEDLRVWAGGDITEHMGGYLRVRAVNIGYTTAPGAVAPDTKTEQGFDVDLAYLDFDLGGRTNLRVGRQFARVGRGLVLALDLDGAQVEHEFRRYVYRYFLGQTVPRDLNIDNSIVGFNKSTQQRFFGTGEVEYTNQRGQTFYGYVAIQKDNSKSKDPTQSARPFRYDSDYLGFGTRGSFNALLHYYMEGVLEGGKAMADVAGDPRVKIDAGALVAGLLYYPIHRWRPVGSLEYAHGSGDSTRASVTNTFGGKFAATNDNNFLYFGVYDGGLALSPRLSNLDVLRFGYQIRPLPKPKRELPELVLGTKLSLYWKDLPGGIISDPVALLLSRDIGFGADLYSSYRPFSDVSFLLQYGRFEPGLAYPIGANDRSSRVLFTTSVSF